MGVPGSRKIWITALGLAALMLLAVLAAFGRLPADALDTLAWAVVFTTAAGIGGNAAEHVAKRGSGAGGKHFVRDVTKRKVTVT